MNQHSDPRHHRGIPRLPAGVVERGRVTDLLNPALNHRVTLLCAPAGSGKSVVVSSWAGRQGTDHQVAWLDCSLVRDNPDAFWAAVVEAVTATGAAGVLERNDSMAVPVDRRELLDRILRWLSEQPRDVVIVFDDFHEVSARTTLNDIQYVVDRLPVRVRLVLVTRSMPQLALHRARVEGWIYELGWQELAFTLTEAADLLAANDIDVDAPDLEILHTRTQGWAAGLRLALISMSHSIDPAQIIRDLAGSSTAVSGYLTEQVLASVDAGDRTLLLQTCVVEELSAPLVETLTGVAEGQRVLNRLAGQIGFLSRAGSAGDLFRYHPMFAELLRSEYRYHDAGGYAEQHRRAAHWYVSQSRPLRAVFHAQQAQDWDLAAELVLLEVPDLVLRGRVADLKRLLDAFPPPTTVIDPRLAVARAVAAVFDNQLDRADALIATAQAGIDSTSGDLASRRYRVMVEYAAGLTARYRGDAAKILQHYRPEGPDVPTPDEAGFRPSDRTLRAAWHSNRAAAYMLLDRHEAATTAARRASEEVHAGAAGWPLITSLAVLAMLNASSGHLHAAETSVAEIVEFMDVKGWSDAPYIATADLAGAWIAMERYDLAGASSAAARAEHRWRRTPSGFPLVALPIVQGRLTLLEHRDPKAARHKLTHLLDRSLERPLPPLVQRLLDFVTAEILLAEGNSADAAHLTVESPALRAWVVARSRTSVTTPAGALRDDIRADVGDDLGLLVRTLLAAGVELHRAGSRGQADAALGAVLDIVEVEGTRLPFVQLGAPAHDLLMGSTMSAVRHGPLIAELLELTHLSTSAATDLIDPLSNRELEILRHLAAGLGIEEICATLVISRNTVRTHVRNIYRKLAVQSRREAMIRAAALDLV